MCVCGRYEISTHPVGDINPQKYGGNLNQTEPKITVETHTKANRGGTVLACLPGERVWGSGSKYKEEGVCGR